MLEVKWAKCGVKSERACRLETLDLSNVADIGVYIIWQSPSGNAVKIGEGNIKSELIRQRQDPEVLNRRGNGVLLVTWANIPDMSTRFGVERYLDSIYSPALPTHVSPVEMVSVNTPE